MKQQRIWVCLPFLLCIIASGLLIGYLIASARNDFAKASDVVHVTEPAAQDSSFLDAAGSLVAEAVHVGPAQGQITPDEPVAIPLSDSQIDRLAETAKGYFLEHTDLIIPEDAEQIVYAYTSGGGVYAQVDWIWQPAEGHEATGAVLLEDIDPQTGEGGLYAFSANTAAEALIRPYIDLVRGVFEETLSLPLPPDKYLDLSIRQYFGYVNIDLRWTDPEIPNPEDPLEDRIARVYYAAFRNVDFRSGDGRLDHLELQFHNISFKKAPPDLSDFTEGEKEALIQAAKRFADEMAFSLGAPEEMMGSLFGLEDGLYLYFSALDGESLVIPVTRGGQVLGFYPRPVVSFTY